MGTREFEHLTRALAIAVFGPGVRPFGDGKDGGREAVFQGLARYPDPVPSSGRWDGYCVIQAKFRQRPLEVGNNAVWLQGEMQKEINQWREQTKLRRKNGRLPEYLLFTTNVYLSAVPGGGGADTIQKFLDRELASLGLKGWDFWDGERIGGYLDKNEGVRKSFNGTITPGDLISKMAEILGISDGSYGAIYETHVIKTLKRDQWVRLGEAGGDAADKLPLAQVAIDLPVLVDGRRPDEEPSGGRGGVLHQTVLLGNRVLRPSDDKPDRSNVVILGGPGQGKSTVSQLLSQVYRLAFMEDYPSNKLDPDERKIRDTLTSHIFNDLKIPRPTNRRWPFTIKLSELGDAVAGGEDVGLLRFIAKKMGDIASDSTAVTPSKLQRWFSEWPCIIILDGLDEVPLQSVREKVFETIDNFLIEARNWGSDLFVVATTRPQGYSNDMSPEVYKHLTLAPLGPDEALSYINQLSAVQHVDDEDLAANVVAQAKEALVREATSRLMVTPLQVTIMSLLLARRITLPESRHELFNSYYTTIYEREMNKSHSHLAALLRGQKRNVEFVHQRVGLALQQKAELVGHADALLTNKQFADILDQRLREEEEFTQEKSIQIRKDLSKTALERLVLLVPRMAGHVGFELRSLQEFMAASFFFARGESQALTPFAATAHSTHWRHTWLLGAGRLFDEHETLRDQLINIVSDISIQSHITRAANIGPLLALDILDDDIATNSPKYLRKLTSIASSLLSAPAGGHNDQLNRVLRETAARDAESARLITEAIRSQLRNSGEGRNATISLLADWSTHRDARGAQAKQLLNGALRDLDPAAAGSMLFYMEGRNGHSELQQWKRKSLMPGAKTDMAGVLRPHLVASSTAERVAKKEILKALKKMPVTGASFMGTTIMVTEEDTSRAQALIDVLNYVAEAPSVLASSLAGLGPAEESLNNVLRGALRMSIDRAHPQWEAPWIEEHSLLGEPMDAHSK
jgi:hypothetical protein